MSFTYINSQEALSTLAARLAERPEMSLAVDTETTGLDPMARGSRLLLCQLALPTGEVYVINAAKLALGCLKPVLEEPTRLLLLQNAKFDYKWLHVKAGIAMRRMYDTMLAELLLNAGSIAGVKQRRQASSLRSLAKRYEGVEMEKATRLEFIGYQGSEFSTAQLQYAASDVPILFPIREKQGQLLQQAALVNAAKLEFAVLPAVAEMELNGLGIDVDRYRGVIEESRQQMQATETAMREYLRKQQIHCNLFDEVDTNFNSPPQIKDVMLLLGRPVASTEEKYLRTVQHPFVDMLLEWRTYETQVSSFGEGVIACIHPVTGRIHPEFDQLGADSGRFSCRKPNLQQIPHEERFRSCFVPGPGNVMVVGDWSQFELRILCEFSGDTNMLAAFHAGRDLHSDTAARMYGLEYDAIGKDHEARRDAKILNFALAYGMGPTSLAASLKCEVAEAKEKMERYFGAYPHVKRWLDRAAEEGVQNLESRTASGRRRLFDAPAPGENYRSDVAAIQRKAKNSPIQGTNGDALKLAMARLLEQVRTRGLAPGIVGCVHDEIIMEVQAERGEEAREVLEAAMVAAGQHYLPHTPVKADVGVAACWEK